MAGTEANNWDIFDGAVVAVFVLGGYWFWFGWCWATPNTLVGTIGGGNRCWGGNCWCVGNCCCCGNCCWGGNWWCPGNCWCGNCSAVVVDVNTVPVAVTTDDGVNVIWLTPDVRISSIDVGGGTPTTEATLACIVVPDDGTSTFPEGTVPETPLFGGIYVVKGGT